VVLEMSIVLWQKITFQDNKEACPWCRHINLNVTVTWGVDQVVNSCNFYNRVIENLLSPYCSCRCLVHSSSNQKQKW
jgi:hypothetical protein